MKKFPNKILKKFSKKLLTFKKIPQTFTKKNLNILKKFSKVVKKDQLLAQIVSFFLEKNPHIVIAQP